MYIQGALLRPQIIFLSSVFPKRPLKLPFRRYQEILLSSRLRSSLICFGFHCNFAQMVISKVERKTLEKHRLQEGQFVPFY